MAAGPGGRHVELRAGGGTLSIAAAAPNEGIRAVHLLNDIHHLTTAEGSFVSH